jgi:hypothetical protein
MWGGRGEGEGRGSGRGGGGGREGARNSVSVLLIVKCGIERQLPHKYPSYRELSNIGGLSRHPPQLSVRNSTCQKCSIGTSDPELKKKTQFESQVLDDQLSIANSQIKNFLAPETSNFELLKAVLQVKDRPTKTKLRNVKNPRWETWARNFLKRSQSQKIALQIK